jgi:polysaccharide export outer membrane protein
MKKISLTLLVFSLFSFLSACSVAPGVPGLNSSASRYAKAQKEGVDYKLVVINANAIRNQKAFNYVAYIENKKKRNRALASATKGSSSNASSHQASRAVASRSYYPHKKNLIGVSSKDNKANYQYRIGKKDILSITVWDHPELTIPSEDASAAGHVVDNDGRFYFPYAGKIHAKGKTTGEVRDTLEKKLATFITNPQISVRVALFRSQKAYISGAVLKPTTLNINDVPTTVRDAISKSGGVTPDLFTGFASLSRNNQKISIDLNRMLKHNDNRQNFLLKNGDRLHIIGKNRLAEEIRKENILNPIRLQFELKKERSIAHLKKELERELKSEQAKVFVMGEVNKPGSVRYQVEDGMTLAEAINDSGSFREETVNPKGIFVVRQENSNDTIPTVYQLPLASVQSMLLAEQFNIRPRDIVYVTATPSIRWNRVLAQLIPSLTLVNTVSNLSR